LSKAEVSGTIGMTREAIHFNMDSDFYPLAHISSIADSHINETVNSLAAHAFKIVLEKRKRDRARKRQVRIPQFHETQLVFMRDQVPGVSTILKIPNRGPYRIDKLEDRNVTLTDIGTGKYVHSHIQNIRPLEISEFRLLLSKGWDLNAHQLKAGLPISRPGIFDFPEHPVPTETVVEIERQQDRLPEEGDLPNLFQAPEEEPARAPPVQAEVPPAVPADQPAAEPPDIPEHRPPVVLRRSPRMNPSTLRLDAMHTDLSESLEISDDECDLGEQTLSVNTVDVHLEISSVYRATLEKDDVQRAAPLKVQAMPIRPILRRDKSVSLYLQETAPYIFDPGQEKDDIL
jgi:hypothetical protein